MGADMIISVIAVPLVNDANQKKLFERIHENIDKATPSDVSDYFVNESRDDEELTFKEAIEEWHSVVKSVEQDFDARDVTVIEHKGDKLYITGGMSWGDNSTDSMADFDHFLNIPKWITAPLLTS